MNIFEKLKSQHVVINFIDEDGNNTLMLMKDKQSIYLYKDYNNVNSMIPISIKINDDKIKFENILPGDKKVSIKIEYKGVIKLYIYKETNSKVVVDGTVNKDETSSKRKGIIAFLEDFVE